MAFPVQITLTTGNTVSQGCPSQEVSVSVTYQLERADADVLAVVREKIAELVAAHRLAWERVRGDLPGRQRAAGQRRKRSDLPGGA